MNRLIRVIASFIAIAAVFGSSMPAAAALPFGRMVSRHQDFTTAFNKFTSATARCPSGDRMVSGGVQLLGGSGAQSRASTWLGSSYPTQDLKGWTGSATVDFGDPVTFRVIVRCAPSSSLPGYTVERKVANLPNRLDEKSAIVSCPAGTKAIAGGTQFLTPTGTTAQPTLPGITAGSVPYTNLSGWVGIGRNIGGIIGPERSIRLRVVAVCAKATVVGPVVNGGANFEALDGPAAVTVACKNGGHAVTGGLFFNRTHQVVDPTLPGRLVASWPTGDGYGWGTVSNDEGGDTSRAIYIYCVRVLGS